MRLLGALAVLGLSVAGCGDDDDSDRLIDDPTTTTAAAETCKVDQGATTDPATTSVDVALEEYTVAATPAEAPAGTIELVATNNGRIPHELVVVRWDEDPGAIPLNPVGGADRQVLGDAVRGRIRSFAVGETCRGTVDLEPGTYVLICNLVDDGANPHYAQGMHTPFVVT